jgi:hypothetical protein
MRTWWMNIKERVQFAVWDLADAWYAWRYPDEVALVGVSLEDEDAEYNVWSDAAQAEWYRDVASILIKQNAMLRKTVYDKNEVISTHAAEAERLQCLLTQYVSRVQALTRQLEECSK